MNIVNILFDQAKTSPKNFAIKTRNENFTFEDVALKVVKAGSFFQSKGHGLGDVVGILLVDPLEHLLTTLAVSFCGGTVFSISSSMPAIQQDRYLKATKTKYIVTNKKTMLTEYSLSLNIIYCDDIYGEFWPLNFKPSNLEAGMPWIYVNGSGSTGRPKIMSLTHDVQSFRAASASSWAPYGKSSTLLSLVSMHFYSAKQRALEAWSIGACIFIGHPGKIDYHHEVSIGLVDVMYATVSHVQNLCLNLASNQIDYYSNLKALIVGGSTVSMQLRDQIRKKLTPNLYVVWGTNESHTSTITELKNVFLTKNTVGKPFSCAQIQILKDDKILCKGEVGDIVIKSKNLISGYLGDEVATNKHFRNDWFYTGDIGYFKDDGQLIHLGRSDDMLIVGGVNIFPTEIEECLRNISGIKDLFITSIKNNILQDIPIALISKKKGVNLNEDVLLKTVRDHLGNHALQKILFVNKIPRNEQGKVQKELIKKMIEQNSEVITHPNHPDDNANNQDVIQITFPLPTREFIKYDITLWINLLDAKLTSSEIYDGEAWVHSKDVARKWLEKVLLLSFSLLQIIRIPIFKPLIIIECEEHESNPSLWVGKFLVPLDIGASMPIYKSIVKIAFKLAASAVQTNPNIENERQYFYGIINEKILNAYRLPISNGKSTFEILRCADNLKMPYKLLANGIIQLGWGANSHRFDRSSSEGDSPIGIFWAKSKLHTSIVLKQGGLPVPEHLKIQTIEQARKAAEYIKYPLVVKPIDAERGEGVTVDVFQDQLESSVENALKNSPSKSALIERQVTGVCYRIFVCAGSLLYAVRRLPFGVYADGQSSIEELVLCEYQKQQIFPPWKRTRIQPLDEVAIKNIGLKNWSIKTVLPKGTFVPLRPIETTAWGGVDEEVTHTIHQDNIKAVVDAANLLGLKVAGVDMISSDITESWLDNGAIINEVNYAPLLGGGEISLRYISEYLNRFVKNNGRIPIHVCIGGVNAWHKGESQWHHLRNDGFYAFLTDEKKTLDGIGQELKIQNSNLAERILALRLRDNVEAIVVIVNSISGLSLIKHLEYITNLDINLDDLSELFIGIPEFELKKAHELIYEFEQKKNLAPTYERVV